MKHPQTKSIVKADYRVRVSPKAKHVCIKVSHSGDVEVVVPKGFDQRHIPDIVQRRRDWIAKTIQRIEAERQGMRTEPGDAMPQVISLRSLPEEWTVTYRPTSEPHLKVVLAIAPKGELLRTTHQLVLQGPIQHLDLCQQVLRRWLHRKAHLHLVPWLEQVSDQIRLPFSTASVRGQKTRWASCSNKKSISLNYKLLFLPPHLVRYVLIHELCHTIHLNHSSAFWALVEEKEPNYKNLDSELRTAWRYVPEWVEQSPDY
ncbi:MAG: SprT family zinc-dependent metalloprotease [Oculatellaceae cyanobacterium bins.114]|nr:SprT family zinc-dependent metalloprotease [Oculatellaceae cyanobacterium bins.114]